MPDLCDAVNWTQDLSTSFTNWSVSSALVFGLQRQVLALAQGSLKLESSCVHSLGAVAAGVWPTPSLQFLFKITFHLFASYLDTDLHNLPFRAQSIVQDCYTAWIVYLENILGSCLWPWSPVIGSRAIRYPCPTPAFIVSCPAASLRVIPVQPKHLKGLKLAMSWWALSAGILLQLPKSSFPGKMSRGRLRPSCSRWHCFPVWKGSAPWCQGPCTSRPCCPTTACMTVWGAQGIFRLCEPEDC